MLGKRREGGQVRQKMLGRYRILGELGRGAMGAVYRAVDLVLEREVALKTLLPDLPEDVIDEVRIRFLREARSAGRLSHPNIVTIFDVGQEGDTAYIAMELLQGRSLRQIDPQIPEGFDRIMDRALAKRPQERYQKAAEMAGDLRNYRSLGGGTVFAKTVPLPVLPTPAAAAEEQKVRNQLIVDLDQFAKNFEAQEKEHLRAEQEERLKKEEAWRNWGAAEEQKRESFERGAPGADPKWMSITRRMEAVEIMRQQAALKKQQASAKETAMAALDSAMRAAHQYLTEFGREMNTHEPHAGKPYEFIYLGRLASVTLTQATVNSRMFKLAADKELCAQIRFHYRVRAAEPPKVMLLGEDVGRCEQYLKSLRVAFQVRANTEGRERPTLFVVSGPLPCEINFRADYEAATATVELINVRRFGRVTVRFPTDALKGVIDDLARYVLGVDNDFSRLLAKA